MSNVEFLVKLRDGAQMIADAANEYLEKIAPSETTPPVKTFGSKATVKEEVFNILKFEPQQGAKIGSYEVAYRANNIEGKWTSAFSILRQSNATINARYHGPDYQFGYWLFGEGKVYRQKLKRAT